MLISIREWLQRPILTMLKGIAMTQAQLAEQLRTAQAAIERGHVEQVAASDALKAEVERLNAALENQTGVSPELQAAVDGVAAAAQRLDDLVQETPVDPTNPPVEGEQPQG
jgi:methyl-accepting chemotaxis protein